MTDAPDLKPCPFCGSAAHFAPSQSSPGGVIVQCSKHMHSDGWIYSTRDRAEEEWNTRATLPRPDDAARIAALEAALKELLEAYEKPDRLMCCNGHHCGCRGASIRDMAEHYAHEALKGARHD